ncbi:allophanate hydrolase [Sphingomonas psychrolutea]|uniref:Allophanate hydrolase n=1 Tax=Sphingomonas psychrolutea TaxID=1259676 RepID=A0ABQ1GFZ2_9SPHN|nr:allophanate hydrolase [Sphingomonas psychrolutea]GGA43020.1 allophanate hydrolase [Sphingomonas psychrolutea]
MTALTRLNAQAIAADVISGRVSAVDLVRDVLARLAIYDAVQPQAWIARFDDATLIASARAVDARIAAGEQLPLAGVPFAVKDNIDVAGIDTTAGCPSFAFRPVASASVVERLLAAGAICIGKTSLDQFATGLNGTRSPYGAPRNAYNLGYVSGGSSSGSAVVVAAGLVAFALGTDTAGSGRVPAAFQHLIGLKPSRGRWSTRGVVPACRTLDCVTVLASTIADARLVDAVAAGFDPADPFSVDVPERPRDARRIGVPQPDQRLWFGDLESERLYDRSLDVLASGGAEIVEFDLAPFNEAAQLLYGGPWVAERTAAIEAVLAADPADLDPVVREVVSAGIGVSAVDLFNGIYRLAELRRVADTLWGLIDLIALPTTGTTYRVAEMRAAPIALNSALGAYTNFVNLLDMAAIALPAGARHNATGFGITLIGPAGTDRALLAAGDAYLETAGLAPPPPLDLEGRMQTVKLAVVGAHLKDMPLHWQLTSRDAVFVEATQTAPTYRLYAMAGSVPPKPALVHSDDGAAILVEVYELDVAAFGSFVVDVPPPLAIGTVTLADGSSVKGFVAEPRATLGAEDITALGGWRAYVARGS